MSQPNRRQLLGLAALAIAAPLTACSTDGPVEPKLSGGVAELVKGDNRLKVERASTGSAKGAAKGMCAFAASLVRTLADKAEGANLLVSPASLALPLAMLANGASAATLTELETMLGGAKVAELNEQLNTVLQTLASRNQKYQKGHRTGEVHLDVANSLWLKQGWKVKQPFLEATAKWYGAGLHGVDFDNPRASADAVNAWAAEHTNDRIKDLLPASAITEQTRMVIANAVWLKAPWYDEFSPATPGPFTRDDGQQVDAQLMRGGAEVAYLGDGYQACTKNYLGHELSMALALPDEGTEQAMLDDWASGGLAEMLAGFETSDVRLTMPKWKFEQELALVAPLKAMGVRHLFVDQRPDLSKLSDEPTGVSAIVQKTWIEVDEKGTEAAAATAAVVGATSSQAPPKTLELVLDRPFWYVIHDRETLTPLFIGRVGDPTAGK